MTTRRALRPLAAIPILGLLAVGGHLALAQQEGKDSGWKEGEGKDGKDAPPEDIEYPGVDPEKNSGIAPLIKKAKASKKTVVTWPGFQMVHGGSRVFVQMLQGTKAADVTAPVRVEKSPVKVEPPYLVYAFDKKVVLIKNNLNPLITRAFNTPVEWVRMQRKKGKVYMIVKLRAAEEPVREEMLSTQDGYHFFFVEFAAGTYIEEEKDDGSSKKILE